MTRSVVLALASALLGGCAHSSLLLLPDEDGGQGAVAVLETKGQPANAVVSQSNSRTTLGQQNAKVRAVGRKGLKAKETSLLAGMPPPPRSFSLYFLQGTTEFTPPSRAVLPALRAEIASRPGADVEVTGHTDTVGGEADNDVLSLKRAEEVLAVLSGQGIDRSLMTAVGRGERELREPTPDGVSNAANRRVEVIVR
jgi:OmpA-OmpF porin, OOP family